MKEKFREFFEKHRHLVVISLILAVILAAATPLVVPLGLKLETEFDLPARLFAGRYDYADVLCYQHETGSCRAIYSKSALEELCRTINRAPDERDKHNTKGTRLCEFYFNKITSRQTTQSVRYELSMQAGEYRLSTEKNRNQFAWHISEQAAQELLRCCWCAEDPVPENPRKALSAPEQLESVMLSIYEQGKLREQLTLSEEQIAAVCAEVDELLRSAAFYNVVYVSDRPYQTGTMSRWSFTCKDGSVYQLQYRHDGDMLVLYVPESWTAIQNTEVYRMNQYTLREGDTPSVLNAALEK